MSDTPNRYETGTAPGSRDYYPPLDGLRAISVLLVIFVHIRSRSGLLAHLQGWLGVDIFLVLSGFLITTLLLREESELGDANLIAFYGRRFFRIVPVYTLMLAIYCAVCRLDPARWKDFKHALPYYLTFTNEFVKGHVPFGATWTIAIEEKFYLLWPLLFFIVAGKHWRTRVIPILFIASFMLPFRSARSYFDLLAGCVLAIILADHAASRAKSIIGRTPVLLLIAGVIGGFVLVDRNMNFVYLFAVVVTWLVGNLVLQPSWLGAILGSPAFVWVGKRSYSMYLVHGLALDAVQRWLTPSTLLKQLSVTVLASAAAALAADVMYRTVEEPMRRYGRSWTKRWTSARMGNGTLSSAGASKQRGIQLREVAQPEIGP